MEGNSVVRVRAATGREKESKQWIEQLRSREGGDEFCRGKGGLIVVTRSLWGGRVRANEDSHGKANKFSAKIIFAPGIRRSIIVCMPAKKETSRRGGKSTGGTGSFKSPKKPKNEKKKQKKQKPRVPSHGKGSPYEGGGEDDLQLKVRNVALLLPSKPSLEGFIGGSQKKTNPEEGKKQKDLRESILCAENFTWMSSGKEKRIVRCIGR